MARSSRSSSGAEPPVKFELKTNAVNISIRIPHRKLTLLTITLLLNTLLWSSIICIIACIFQVVSDPDDKTNIAPVVLTLTSVGTDLHLDVLSLIITGICDDLLYYHSYCLLTEAANME
jgi:hypothetical protein